MRRRRIRAVALGCLAACLFPLAACRTGGTAVETPPGVESQAPAPESRRPDLPWPVEPQEAPSYQEYFSELISYGFPDPGAESWKVTAGGNLSGYTLTYEAPGLYLDAGDGTRQWLVAQVPELELVCYDPQWIYGVVGGTQLIRMDYYGENRQVLFEDPSGMMSLYMLGDDKVFYFWAGLPEGGAAIYRLYIPETRADLVYEPGREELENYYMEPASDRVRELLPEGSDGWLMGTVSPVSNYEFTWTTLNRAFLEYYDLVAGDPAAYPQFFEEMEEYQRIGLLEQASHELMFTDHYYNAYTGSYLERPNSGYSNAGGAWWLPENP